MILFYSLYGMLVCLMAYRDSCKIEKDKKVNHFLNGGFHIGAGVISWFLFGWPHFFGVLLLARIVFDTSLNLFRHLNPFYVPLNPASWVDRLEKKIFPSKVLANGVYIISLLLIWFYA